MDEHLNQESAQRMGALAGDLQAEDSCEGTLRAIVHGALELVPGARWAGICLIGGRGRRISVEASSHDLVLELDQLQSDLGKGPCWAAIRRRRTAQIADLAEPDQPWPRFAATALERGVHGVMSLPLSVRRKTLGALNLYTDHPDAFPPDAESIAGLLARHAAVALAGASTEQHLNAALENRDVLSQAKGILMQRDGLTALQAFQLLARTSQDANIKVADVARWLVAETEKTALPAAGSTHAAPSSDTDRPRRSA